MSIESVATFTRVVSPASAPEVLVEDAGRSAHNLWWDDRDESLWWTDLEGGTIYRLNPRTRISSAIYHGPNVSAFLPQENQTWLLFREKDIALLDFERHLQVTQFIPNVRFDGDRFNECIADPSGRVFIGTVRQGRPNGAGVYRLDNDGTLAKSLGGTGESNGMGWNGRGDALYWACGTTRTICRCKYDEKRGALTNRQVFHECQPDEGTPTGLAVDSEGTIWSARRDAGVVLKIGENRQLLGQVTIPARHATSIAFGGADRRTVFVSAMNDDGHSKIFALRSSVPGAVIHRARIDRSRN